jgi:hypothetical protein
MRGIDSYSRRRPVTASVLLAALVAIFAAGPVGADTELGHKGKIGAHSLRDTYTNGAAKCTYRTTFEGSGSHWWRLRRIDVRPPRVFAISGSQKVGWRFVVQRSKDQGPWQVAYRSQVQKATASVNSRAAFESMGSRVSVPPPSSQFDNHHFFRVVVKMIWYRADGSQQGSARHLVDFYREQLDGEVFAGDGEGACQGIKGQVV